MWHSASPNNHIAEAIIQAAQTVHCWLGPGLREHVYQDMLAEGVRDLGYTVARQEAVPLVVDGRRCNWLYPDLIVGDTLIVECKASADWLRDSDLVQMLTYLAVCQLPVGLLINFGMPKLEYRRTRPPGRPKEWIRHVAPFLRHRRWGWTRTALAPGVGEARAWQRGRGSRRK